MLDLRWIRDNPTLLDTALTRRGAAPLSAQILSCDSSYRATLVQLQELQQKRNTLAKEIGAIKSQGGNAAHLMAEAEKIKNTLPALEAKAAEQEEALQDMLARIPNVPDADVPTGPDERANVELRRVGAPRTFDFPPLDHVALGENLGLMDFEAASRMSGARFVVLKGALARLERALAAFMLSRHAQNGYTEMSVPLLVKSPAVFGTGQLPKFGDDLFETTDGRWLIPTAEVSLTNMVAGDILPGSALPKRLVAATPCFRSEAGSAGRDTYGMIRQHQFLKVELVSITRPDQSETEHIRMTQAAEGVLEALGLPYRTIILSTGDMGGTAAKTYDLEVWIPSQNMYREISSCSNCRDYQARRMNARFRPDTESKPEFVHTLNGSGVAVGRALVAILENYQQADGSIVIPEALQPYMDGLKVIMKESA